MPAYLLTPSFFERWSNRLFWPLAVLGIFLCISGLYYGLIASPPDYQQGETVRIMYIHVPSAWMALMIYTIIAFAGAFYLIWRNPMLPVLANAAAPIGAVFTLMTLITGSIWGKPTWGTWWQWDARMTSVLILFFLYIGYIALTHAFESEERAAFSAAWLSIIGFINIPIIKFSVEWWNTLHQPASISRLGSPAIDSSMLIPLFLMYGAWLCYFGAVLILRMKMAVYRRKMRRRNPAG
ncbi:MAG: heme ABC transporter permease [Proteobacteria bacterium]|nr:heme ABC transporter permease [Pseudomonadota bacterium]